MFLYRNRQSTQRKQMLAKSNAYGPDHFQPKYQRNLNAHIHKLKISERDVQSSKKVAFQMEENREYLGCSNNDKRTTITIEKSVPSEGALRSIVKNTIFQQAEPTRKLCRYQDRLLQAMGLKLLVALSALAAVKYDTTHDTKIGQLSFILFTSAILATLYGIKDWIHDNTEAPTEQEKALALFTC